MTTTPNDQYVHDPDLDTIWNLLDYGWLSDAARPKSLNELPPPRRPTVTSDDAPQLQLLPVPTNEPIVPAPTLPEQNHSYAAFEPFDLDKGFAVHDEVAMDFASYPEGTIDPWPDVLNEGDVFLSTGFGISSPWTPRAPG